MCELEAEGASPTCGLSLDDQVGIIEAASSLYSLFTCGARSPLGSDLLSCQSCNRG
jgi:hypothetical protein